MNKKLLAAAVSAAVMAPHAEATIYGNITNAIHINSPDDGDNSTNIDTLGSRLGVKYSGDLGNGLTVSGKYEVKANTDDSSGSFGDVRVATVGISGGFGSINIGQQWSAYFNTFGTLVSPTYTVGHAASPGIFRTADTIKYANSFGPVSMELDYRINEGNGSDEQDKGGYGVGFSFAPVDNLTIAVAFDRAENSGDNGDAIDKILGMDERLASVATLGAEVHTLGIAGITQSTKPAAWKTATDTAKTRADEAVTAAQTTLATARTAYTTADSDSRLMYGVTGLTSAQVGAHNTASAAREAAATTVTNAETALDERISDQEETTADVAEVARLTGIYNSGGANEADRDSAFATAVVKEGDIPTRETVAETAIPATLADKIHTGISATYDFGAVKVAFGLQNIEEGDKEEIDGQVLLLSGSITEKTSWLLGFAESEQGDVEQSSTNWGLYHSLGGGVTLGYEALSIDKDDDSGGDTHYLFMRINF
ncbi:porin [Candidatus Spongiihabitans sp.]|uniref:porin n=1 Tax=Candidatus Spongiihabitans sp. TaxID=3101308 RepID=UPI003C7CE35A